MRDDLTYEQEAHIEDHAEEKRMERKEKDDAHSIPPDEVEDLPRCKMCGDTLMLYNDELIIDGHCPYCSAKNIKETIRQKKEGIMDKEMVAVVKDTIVMPAVTPDEAVAKWKEYQVLKEKICEPKDVQEIQGKSFLKKSYWRKLATFFNLSVEIVDEKTEQIGMCGKEVLVYHFRARASHKNGRYAEGTGSCDIYDHATIKDGKFMVYDKYKKDFKEAVPKSIHNARTTAETRAWNRAVSNLVGGGEVSAEEVTEAHDNANGFANNEQGIAPPRLITEKQQKRLFAISQKSGVPNDIMRDLLQEKYGFTSAKEITMDKYEEICKYAEDWQE